MNADLTPLGSTSAAAFTLAQLDARYVNVAGGDTITGETFIKPYPTESLDIANKIYVDTQTNTICNVNTGISKACLTLDGVSAMTGNLNLGTTNKIINSANPSNPQDVATKYYVDNNAFNATLGNQDYLRLDGTNNPTANLSMNSNRLINVSNPINQQDASTMNSSFNASGVSIIPNTTANFTGEILKLDTFVTNLAVANTGTTLTTSPSFTDNPAVSTNPVLPTLGTTTLNGFNFLNFNGSQYMGGNAITFTAPSTYFVVCNPSIITVRQRVFSTGNNLAIGLSNSKLILSTTGILDYVTSTTAVLANTWVIMVFRFNSNFSVDFATNGSQSYENITGTVNANTSSLGTSYFGANVNSSSAIIEYWNGSIAGVYAHNTAFANAQIDQFVGILAYQFNLVNLLPSNHTYKTNPPLARISALNMNNYGINNLANPVNPQDAVTLNYVSNNTLTTATANSTYLMLNGGNILTGLYVYRIYFTTTPTYLNAYTVDLLIGESPSALSYNFAITTANPSITFPSGIGASCSWAFGLNGDNLFPFWVAQVTGTAPGRTANVFVYVSGSNIAFNNLTAITLNVTFTGATLQSIAGTFPVFGDNFPGTSINTTKWPTAVNVVVANNTAKIGSTTSTGSSIKGVATGYGDNIELVFYGSLESSTSVSFVGGGFLDYFILNAYINSITEIANITTISSSEVNDVTALYNQLTTRLTGNHFFRIRRSGTSGIVWIDGTAYSATITAANTTNSYIQFLAYDANQYTTISYVGIRNILFTGEPVFNLMGSIPILNMNGLSITNLGSGGTLSSDTASIGNVNTVVNAICSTIGGTTKPCLTLDGTTIMNGNLNLNTSNRIINVANPVNAQDVVTINYLTSSKYYCTMIVFNSSAVSTNSATSNFTINNTSFTSSNVLQTLMVSPFPVTSGDRFAISSEIPGTFGTGTFTFTVTVTYLNSSTTGWAESLELTVQILYH